MNATRLSRSRTPIARAAATTVVLALALGLLFGGGAFARIAGVMGYGCGGYSCPPPPPCYIGYGGGSCDQDARPQADFAASPSAPRVGATVTLSAFGTRPYSATIKWDLDNDGAFDDATGVETTTTFATAGRHLVRIEATDEHGRTSTATRDISVHTENFKPSAELSYNPTQPRTGHEVSFYGYGTDIDGTIVKREVDFDGDGTYDAELTPDSTNPWSAPVAKHTYAAAGQYQAALRVTDDAGGTAVVNRTVSVHDANVAPRISYLYSDPQAPRTGKAVSISGSALDPDGLPAKIELDADGDGTFDHTVQFTHANTSFNIAHTYAAEGEYEAVLRVTDADGATGQARRTISVHSGNYPPTVSLGVTPYNPKVGAIVQVSAYAYDPDGSIASTAFDLDGDGTFETPASQFGYVNTTFTTPGDHIVRARTTDNDGATRVDIETISVSAGNAAPRASLGMDPNTRRPTLGQTLNFNAWNSQDDGNIAEYAWDLDGDGDYDDLAGQYSTTTTKTFSTTGAHEVGLRVTDADGLTDAQRLSFYVAADGENSPPVAFISAWPGDEARVNATTSLYASGSSDIDLEDGESLSYEWDTDGDTVYDVSGSSSVDVSFPDPGEHIVRLRVTDPDGASDETTIKIDVFAENRPPTVGSFYTNPTRPKVGDTVEFSSWANDPDGFIATYAWELDGDDDFDDIADPSSYEEIVFDTPGEKTVKLRVTDDEGLSATRSVTLLVLEAGENQKPTVSISGGSRSKPGATVHLSVNAQDHDGTIATRQWDLDGDGQFDDSTEPYGISTSFAEEGIYDVRLRVTDDAGAIATAVHTITVSNVDLPPSVSLSSTSGKVKPGVPVFFYDSAADPEGSALTRVYDFGDGTPTETMDPWDYGVNHTFAAAGDYTVKLTVTDAGGQVASATRVVRVSSANLDPTVNFSVYPSPPRAGEPITLQGAGMDQDSDFWTNPLTYKWEFDGDSDFNDATGMTTSRVFAEPGKHEVSLRVTDVDGGSATYTRTIAVASADPLAAFTVNPEHPTTADTVQFTSSSTDSDGTIAQTDWDLDGDGQFDDATGTTASKQYTEAGHYEVALRVRDADDDIDVERRMLEVRCGTCPVAAFAFSPAEPATGDEITLTSEASDPNGTITSHAWDLDGDGSFDDAEGATVKKTFTTSGLKQVGLKVTDNEAKTDAVYRQILVGNRRPTGDFTWTPALPTSGDEVTFTGTGSDIDGTVTGYAWDVDFDGFDDGSAATMKQTFSWSGVRTVRLRLTDDSGESTIVSKSVTIANRVPTAAVTHTPAEPLTNQTITFSASGSTDLDGSITAYEWDLDDDGEYDDGTNTVASKSYTRPGEQTVGLRVRDNSGAEDTVEHVFTVGNRAPVATVSVSPEFPDVGEVVTFTSTSTDPDGTVDELTYEWDLDADGFDDGTTKSVTKTFAAKDVYAVALRVTDANGTKTTKTIDVAVGNDRPQPSFSSSPSDPLSGEVVTFTSTSTDPDGTIVSFAWDTDGDATEDFNDGTAATSKRTYTTPGEKLIRLKVTDNRGGSAIGTGTVTIGNRPPVASFTVSDYTLEVGQGVELRSTSTDPDGAFAGLTYKWDTDNDGEFDDGTTRTVTPSYSEPGDKVVRLRVTDAFGGSSDAQQTITVRGSNQAPNGWVYPERYEARTGQPIRFFVSAWDNDGDGIKSIKWDGNRDGDFDDAEDTAVANPADGYGEHTFTFTEEGRQYVKAEILDGLDERVVVEGSVLVTNVNRAPEAYLYADRNTVRVGVDVSFTAYAYDSDDGIALYEWDMNGDGDYTDAGIDRSGATLSTVKQAFTAAGPQKVNLRVSDKADPAATTETAVFLTVITGNNAPNLSVYHWPWDAKVNEPVHFQAWAWDTDGDAITKWEWDFDGDGTYEVAGADKQSPTHTYALPGTYKVKLRATDAGGAGGVTVFDYELKVTKNPPKAVLKVSNIAPEKGETVKLTSESFDPDTDGSIVKTEWDTDEDGDYDDGLADGTATFKRDVIGHYTVRLRVTDNDGEVGTAVQTITVRNPSLVSIPVPEPIKIPGTDTTVNIGTSINPETGQTTITIPRGQASQFPESCVDLQGDFEIKAGVGTIESAFLIVKRDGIAEQFAMHRKEDLDAETWHWVLRCAGGGSLFVGYDVTEPNPDDPTGEPITTHYEVPIGGIQLIDPQGVVYDEAQYDEALAGAGVTHDTATEEQRTAARATAAISGATVKLQRFVSGAWKTLPASDPGISPNVNPQVTGSNGLYQWDVSEGVYRVVVTKSGYGTVESTAVNIPPPVLDLHIPMSRNTPPTAALEASDLTPARGQKVDLTSQSTDTGGGSIKSLDWDLDGDGEFDDAQGTHAEATFDSLGEKTVKLRATDNSDDTDVATLTLNVLNAVPTAEILAPATTPTLAPVTFAVQAADPDGSIKKIEWDLDEVDGFEVDGLTSATTVKTFPRSDAERVVKVRVTDSDDATTVDEFTIVVTNQAPTATLTVPAAQPTKTPVEFSVTAVDVDGLAAPTAKWDLDDDGEFDDATGLTATKSFARSGTYPVAVEVTDDEGAKVVKQGTMKITNQVPTATLTVPAAKPTKEAVEFSVAVADVDGLVAPTAKWDLDDDGQFDDATGLTATKSFDRSGAYPIAVEVTDDEGAKVVEDGTMTITNQAPTATMTAPVGARPTKEALQFSVAVADADGLVAPTAKWDLDADGQFDDATGLTATKSFDRSGSYSIAVEVTDDQGAKVVEGTDVMITNQAPTATLTLPATSKPTKEAVQFSVAVADADGLVAPSVAWDLDDDGQFDDGTALTASRSFDRSGAYPIKVRVTDDQGVSVDRSGTMTITNQAPTATLTVPATSPTKAPVEFSVVVADADGLVAPTAAWDLDNDGQYDDHTGLTATKSFGKAGTFPIKVRVTDDQGASVEKSQSITITNQIPTVGEVTGPATVKTGEDATFTVTTPADVDGTIASVAWAMDEDDKFDDQGTGNSITHKFAKSDTERTVKVKVTDDDGGFAIGTAKLVVTNRAPVASFTVAPEAPVAGAEVTFASTSSDPDGTVAKTEWDLDGDQKFDDGTGASAKRAFPAAGTRTIRVRVTDDEGATTVAAKDLTVKAAAVTPPPAPNPTPTPQPPAPKPDTQAPQCTAKSATGKFRSAASKGIGLGVKCDEAASASGTITINARTAKKLGLGKKAIKIASGKLALAGGEGVLKLKFTSKAGKALKKQRKALKLQAVIAVVDAAGNAGKVTVSITLKK